MELNLPDGEAALGVNDIVHCDPELFTLTNSNGLRMSFSSSGAALTAFLVPDGKGRIDDIVLGYEHAVQYLHDEYYMGTVVGRYANRIAGHDVSIDNKKYKLRSKKENFHHHGGVEGFNLKNFEGKYFTKDGASGVEFRYTSPDQEEGYPGEFRLRVRYTLTENNEWIVEYFGVSDKTTIVNLTQHSYFNLAGHAAGNTDDHELQIFADRYLQVNELQIPTGELAAVVGTDFDFTVAKRMRPPGSTNNEQLALSGGYDHSFVLDTTNSGELKHAARVSEPSSGRLMDVWTTEPAVHFYAGNFLHDVPGKDGAVYQARSGFCLETQHFPDSPNQPSFPSTILKAGEELYSKTVFCLKNGCQEMINTATQ